MVGYPNECEKKVKQKDLQQHMVTECLLRKISCDYCNESVLWNELGVDIDLLTVFSYIKITWYSLLILFVTLSCVILYIIWKATPPTQFSHRKPLVKTDLYGAGWVDVSWSQFALQSHTHTHKLQVSCYSKENKNWKIFFVVVPHAPIYHIPIGLNNIFNNY